MQLIDKHQCQKRNVGDTHVCLSLRSILFEDDPLCAPPISAESPPAVGASVIIIHVGFDPDHVGGETGDDVITGRLTVGAHVATLVGLVGRVVVVGAVVRIADVGVYVVGALGALVGHWSQPPHPRTTGAHVTAYLC